MAAKWLRFAVPGVVVALGAGGVFLSKGEKDCKDLVKTSNAIVDAGNNAKTDAEVDALLPRMKSTAKQMRSDAGDYSSKFATDARDAATALEVMATAIEQRDGSAYDKAIDQFNAVVDRTNSDCDKA